jgi:hypothetical protein
MSAQTVTRQWGVWSRRLREWFNPGTPTLGFPSREEAERALVQAKRQYPRGDWVVAEIPEDGTAPRLETA